MTVPKQTARPLGRLSGFIANQRSNLLQRGLEINRHAPVHGKHESFAQMAETIRAKRAD